ncbi:serine hydrolase domain-containing protein [Spirosoma sp. SC4-14]|uniref:serine hydrolase domain-containing protein n=1 Tax=Spirosoma sp. SC4-14 TaxID=3128900 RepID=UPI0030D03692
MKTTLSVLALLNLLACTQLDVPQPQSSSCPPDAFAAHPKHQRYLNELQQYRQNTGSPGSLLLIQKPDEALWVGAVGKANLEYQTDMRVCAQFRVGSITKVFTAVVALKLMERGQLRLDDKLGQLLPSTVGRIPQADQITLRHLLSHTSGLVDPPNSSLRYQLGIVNDYQARFRMSTHQLLTEYIYEKPLLFSPGTQFRYSNAGYWLLGLIIEQQTGKPLQDVFSELIFQPLGLTDTYLEVRDDRKVVRGYADLYGNRRLFDVSHLDRADSDGEADGGIISTATDLARFMAGLFRGHLLSEASLSQMMTSVRLPTCPNGDCEYGLGLETWATELGTAYGHNGSSVGFEANALYFPHNNGVFILYKNNGNGSDKSLMNRLMK